MEDYQPDTMKQARSFKLGHNILGTIHKHCSFEQISVTHANNPAFSQFQNGFSQFLRAQSEFTVADLDMILSRKAKVRLHYLSTWLTPEYKTF